MDDAAFPGSAEVLRRALLRLVDGQGGRHQSQVRERLGDVAELAARPRVVLLGKQADVVAQRQQVIHELARLGDLALERQHLDQPERAGQERSLAGRQAVALAHLSALEPTRQEDGTEAEVHHGIGHQRLDELDRRARAVEQLADVKAVVVEAVAAHPTRPLVAAGFANGQVVIAAIGGRDELLLRQAGAAVTRLAFSPDGNQLAIGDADGALAIASFPSQMFK